MYFNFVDAIKGYVVKGMMSVTSFVFIDSNFIKFICEINIIYFDFF
jgi:hypothetical protein